MKKETAGLCSWEVVEKLQNRFDAVLILANRAREINRGDFAHAPKHHSAGVKAMIEVETGHIGRERLFSNLGKDKQGRK